MTVARTIAVCLSIPVILAAGLFAYSRLNPVMVVAVTELDASPNELWAVLADTDRYSEWNPSIIESSGTVAAGEKLHNTVIFGEMGIGNTTTSAAVTAGILKLGAADVTGRGAGLDDRGLERKIKVV